MGISSIQESNTMKEVAFTASFTAMVFLSTTLFYIALISSTGFFNIGEAFVYLAALLGGPIVGMIAGGLGAAMADMVLGYGVYAPATLILKGMEGFVAGFIYTKGSQISKNARYGLLVLVTIILISFSVFVTTPALNRIPDSSTIQINLRVLDIETILKNLSDPFIEEAYEELVFVIPGIVVVLFALVISAIIWYIELKWEEKGEMVLACLLAGPIIVVGYFLYQVLVLQVPFGGALSEVPFNIAQVIFGIVISVPIVSYLKEIGIIPDTNRNKE